LLYRKQDSKKLAWRTTLATRDARRTRRTQTLRMSYVISSLLCSRRTRSWLTCLINAITYLERPR
jgi:hypothetical protein